MIKKILSIVAFLSLVFPIAGNAQNQQPETAANLKGDWTLSVNFGIGSHIGQSAPAPNLNSYTFSAPVDSRYSGKPVLEVEFRRFMSDKWAMKLSGGFGYDYSPGYREVTGSEGVNGVPTYNAVPSGSKLQFAVTLGADRYWSVCGSSRLFFRCGGEAGFAYGQTRQNADDSEAYMGASIGEAYAFKVAPVAGFDFFFGQVLFAGIEIRPVEYRYSTYSIRPQTGLGLLSSDNHNISFLSVPMLKFGVRLSGTKTNK